MIEALLNFVTVGQRTSSKMSQELAKSTEEVKLALEENKQARLRAMNTITHSIAKAAGAK